MLKSVRIGNHGTGISPLPYLTFDPAPDSLGVPSSSAPIVSNSRECSDTTPVRTDKLTGALRSHRIRIPLGSYIRGTLLALPGATFPPSASS
jgi:hypothetical protein